MISVVTDIKVFRVAGRFAGGRFFHLTLPYKYLVVSEVAPENIDIKIYVTY